MESIAPALWVTTLLSYAETFSILVRKKNQSLITSTGFQLAISGLQNEFILNPGVCFLNIGEDAYLSGLSMIEKHNLNATDAVLLAAFKNYALSERKRENSILLVASDRRLLRASEAEGLHVLNPEIMSAEEALSFVDEILRAQY